MKTSTTGKPASGRAGAKKPMRSATIRRTRDGTERHALIDAAEKQISELLERIDRGLTEAEARADRLLGKLG